MTEISPQWKTTKILFVDDEKNLLEGIRRSLHRVFNVHTACGAKEALEKLEAEGPFGVVVSDMRMPGMDGVTLLSRVREQWPDAVRVMLTGCADIDGAVAAVNEGNIFRFVTKPTSAETMGKVLIACIRQYRLVTAEKELLENTLKGSIQVLVDILSMANPSAFSRAMRMHGYVKQLIKKLNIENGWQYEVAAMLSQLGCITVPEATLEKYYAGEKLSPQQDNMIKAHPEVARRLVAGIPRLENVAAMIAAAPAARGSCMDKPQIDPVQLGAHLIKAVQAVDIQLSRGDLPVQAIGAMADQLHQYDPRILDGLRQIEYPALESVSRMMPIHDLWCGLVLAEDIRTRQGLLVAAKGQAVNETTRQRLHNFAMQGEVPKEIRVTFSPAQKATAGRMVHP